MESGKGEKKGERKGTGGTPPFANSWILPDTDGFQKSPPLKILDSSIWVMGKHFPYPSAINARACNPV